jgi:hypothetical protein
MTRSAPWLCAVIAIGLAPGCDELDEFRTGPDEIFHGQVIGGEMDGGASFVRSGFEPRTEMELTFDPELAAAHDRDGEPRSAGAIHTYECPPESDLCAESRREAGHFDHARLEAIPELASDALSQYDFPGGGRLRNYMFGARFRTPGDTSSGISPALRGGEMSDSGISPALRGDETSGAQLRDAMVFISLMENGRIEVRVIAQSAIDADGVAVEPGLFGVFALERRAR